MYVNTNHQYFYPPPPPAFVQYCPQPVLAPAPAPAPKQEQKKEEKKPEKKEEKKEKAAPSPPPPPTPASTVVSAASTKVSAASTKVSSSASTAVASKKSAATANHVNGNNPPPMRSGTNYMFPREHTKLHIFHKAARVWEDKYKGKKFEFKIFTVSTGFSPAMVIENTLGKKGGGCKGWAVTEVFEKGDGNWAKVRFTVTHITRENIHTDMAQGTTIEYTCERAKNSLASMGWTTRRGEALPPVWLVVSK
jgi:hypothetical protein